MQTPLILPSFAASPNALMKAVAGKLGHETLESNSVLLWLPLAWGQKLQFAVHLPTLYVIRYAVVGCASNLALCKPKTMAVPNETRVCAGMLSAFGHCSVKFAPFTMKMGCGLWFFS